MMRVSDYIAQSVYNAGARATFMLSGGMMMHLMDAIARVPGMKYYCNHHEQACAMAADAFARESGRLGVCLVTSGPGATNLLTGVCCSFYDSGNEAIWIAPSWRLRDRHHSHCGVDYEVRGISFRPI